MNKKIIRVISFVMALMLAFGVMAFAAEDVKKAVFTVETVTVDKGEGTAVVELPIKFEGSAKLTALQLEIRFGNGLKMIEFVNGDVLKGVVEPAVETNPVTIPFVDTTVMGVDVNDGTFATLKMEVAIDKAREYVFEVVVVTAVNEQYESVENAFEVVNGKVVVKGDESEPVEQVLPETEPKDITVKERTKDSILLKINTNLAMAFGEMVEIDNTNTNVVPYIVNGRTLVPLRFVSETLGAEVVWEDGWDYCTVKKNEKEIKITFGSADIEVGGEVITYDAPIQVVEGRTMVPIRFISETLGYDVYWNEPNKIVAISPVDNPWVKDRDAELSAINSMMVTLLLKRKL